MEPEDHECVTIFFSDIVGFTDISRELAPREVMEMLDRLYESFDSCAKLHNIFKVRRVAAPLRVVVARRGAARSAGAKPRALVRPKRSRAE